LGGQVLRASLTPWQKIEAVLHLGGYLIHPLMIVLLLSTVPLMLAGRLNNLPLAGLGLAAFGHPLMTVLGQLALYPDWKRRLLYFPVLMLLGMGLAVNNTQAAGRAFSGKPLAFQRTPKYHTAQSSVYALPVDRTTWLELALCLYAAIATGLSLTYAPALTPFMTLYALGLGYVAGLSLWQARGAWRRRAPAAQAPGHTVV
jgi:hypothetical protein